MLIQGFDFHFLLHSAHLLEERLRARLTPLGVHPRQARVLDALGRMGEASQVTLAKEFDLTAASMSTMTVRLLEAGLIERHVDEHELRSNVLRLSKRGKSLLKSIYREWRAMDREISDVLADRADHPAGDADHDQNDDEVEGRREIEDRAGREL